MSVNHEEIGRVMSLQGGYGKGVTPNPYVPQDKEWARRSKYVGVLNRIQDKIVSLYEPRFITPPATAEAIAALVTLTDSRSVLELGTHTGFTTYHILKALYGKDSAGIVTVDCTSAHDGEFFQEFSSILTHVNGKTPECLSDLAGPFDFVFVDSDHSIEHTAKELDALMPITKDGSVFVFHDVSEWCGPDNQQPSPVREWLLKNNKLRGLCLPTGEQADCLATWGSGYPRQCNPGLGVFVRL